MIDQVHADDIELAHELASVAAEAALPHAGGAVEHRLKGDGSPVSVADLAAERAMLDVLARRRPDDGIVSEEAGTVATGRRRWVLDPIDGTVAFVAGGPEWGTHVVLEEDGEIVLGVITRPLRRERWWAARGQGAFASTDADPLTQTAPLAVSTTTALAGATIGLYRAEGSAVPDVLTAHGATTVTHRSHILDLVEGRIDAIVADRCGAPWDHAPAVVLAVEAGGRFTDPHGGPRPDLRGGIYSNAHLHDAVRDALHDAGIDLTDDLP